MLLVAQAQAKHDASQLFTSCTDAGQEHVDDEQTIFDLDEEEEEDSEDVEGAS